MSDYIFRVLGQGRVRVVKFDGHKEPDAVYYLHYNKCTCPRGENCRHLRMVVSLLRRKLLGVSGVYEEETDKFYEL
jgi:hypothetical protein